MITPDSTGDNSPQFDILRRGAVDLIEEQQTRKLLALGRPLRIKLGLDPSSPDLHVGHAIQLLKLRDLQELGHQIVLIVGDATAMIGDPTGRNKLRPQLTREAVEENLVTYTDQAAELIDMERTEVRRNSEWFDAMDFQGLVRLTSRMTVARMIERDTFQQRMEASEPIGIHEFLYPLMQGWDSVMVKADLELGGTDQLFNLLVGRDLQREEGQMPQVCLTLPLINGSDGRKMSKSYGNAIPFKAEPADMFGKVMAIEDEVMGAWFTLLTRLPQEEITTLLAGHPRRAKAALAADITARFHGAQAAQAASEAFDRQFQKREVPEDMPEHVWPDEGGADLQLATLLKSVGLAPTTSEARRLVKQGGVRLDGEVQSDPVRPISPGAEPRILQVGRR
ncbi:MAG: tyrosine--tRNA ligase, partial [Planctomycetota bacterium]|nr:tyrosine--tRNA ligase [Planctomycetota bacterium]